jgi:proline racemase
LCHAGGEVGNVVVGGVDPPPGDTVFEQMQTLRRDDSLRRFLLREPRGSVAMHANLVVPATREDCAAGYIIMEPTEYPRMSGSNTICVATVLLETGRVPMREPRLWCGSKHLQELSRSARRVTTGASKVEVTNVPSFVAHLDAPLGSRGSG